MRTRSLLLLSLSVAATAQADPPSGPLLRAPGDFARWEVISVYSGKSPKKDHVGRHAKSTPSSPENRLQKLVTTRTGRLVHEERTDFAQRMTDVWYDGGTQYTRLPGATGWLRVESNSGDPSYRPLPERGYRDVDLIQPVNYVGTATYGQRPCLVFALDSARKIDWAKPAAAQKQLKSLDAVAFVDADTRLPVEIRAGGETRTFQFDPPPTRPQTLPADLTAQTKRGDDARTRLNQPAPRPY